MSALAWQMPLGAFIGIFLFRLIAAPYWMHLEQEAKLAETEKERARLAAMLEDRERTELAKKTIGILMEHATRLRFEKIEDQPGFEGWLERADEWLRSASSEIGEKVSREDRAFFMNVSPPSFQYTNTFNETHGSRLGYLDQYSNKLELIFTRLGK